MLDLVLQVALFYELVEIAVASFTKEHLDELDDFDDDLVVDDYANVKKSKTTGDKSLAYHYFSQEQI